MTLSQWSAIARAPAYHLAMAGRLSRDLPRYLRKPLTVQEARERTSRHLQARERRFLAMVDHAIYGYERSPYAQLLRNVNCEPGDLHALVAREGLEGTLRVLAEQGVYVGYDELKGRQIAVRGSARFTFSDSDFDNPLARPHFFQLTGGSRGRPTRVYRTLGSVTDMAAAFALAIDAHGIERPRNLFWIGAAPAWALVHLKLGQRLDAWFYPVEPLPMVARLGLRYVAGLARLAGHQIPLPEHCDLQEPERIATWLADHASVDRPIVVNAVASASARIAVAAASMGRRLDGVVLRCRSEPLTPARRQLIEEVGAHPLPNYAAMDFSTIGWGCARDTTGDDVHLQTDRYAVVERQRPLFEAGPLVDALVFTTLGPHAPKIALNAEIGDSARIEQRACGCALGDLGLTTHLSEIRSFEKLSTEGTSFARSNLVQILEAVLPARFGGTALDYQIVEEEVPGGAGRLVLRIHPDVGPIDDAAVLATLIEEMGRGDLLDQYQARLLERARSIVVERRMPVPTRAGKVLPLQLRSDLGVRS